VLFRSAAESELFEKLVLMVQFAKKEKLDVEAAFLEELIDACVMELYFPAEMAAKGLAFIKPVSLLFDGKVSAPSAKAIQVFHSLAAAASHPLRSALDRLTTASPDLFSVIREEGKV